MSGLPGIVVRSTARRPLYYPTSRRTRRDPLHHGWRQTATEARATSPDLDPRLSELLQQTGRAKRVAAAIYAALRDRVPGATATLSLSQIAADEQAHAAALDALCGAGAGPGTMTSGGLAGCNPHGESWASGLMAAFALDQAATAALIALATATDARVADVARRLVAEENMHQSFAVGAFRALANADPARGMPLAKEMIVNRDWVKEVYPRRTQLVAVAEAGLIDPSAPKAHDTFLASLGDRIQDALGVLGDL